MEAALIRLALRAARQRRTRILVEVDERGAIDVEDVLLRSDDAGFCAGVSVDGRATHD